MAGAIKPRREQSAAESAGAAIGTVLGLALMDKMIDALVRPEMVMSAMNQAKLQGPLAGSSGQGEARRRVNWTIERKGTYRVIAFGSESPELPTESRQRVGFVFDRSGFAEWKLTQIRLPDVQQSPDSEAMSTWAAAGSMDTDQSFLSSLELY